VAFGSLHGEAYISTGFDINTDPTGYMSPKIFIKSNGNVGIGTTIPSEKLELNGNLKLSYGVGDYGAGRIQAFSPGDIIGFTMNSTSRAWDLVSIVSSATDYFAIRDHTAGAIRFMIDENGNVGIGTTGYPGNYKLAVNGTIRAKEVKVETNWSDFVFEDNYNLPTLDKVESYIKENKHLPDVPSAKQVEEEGLSMSQMMAKQMQKIEELTLYVIEQNKQIAALKTELSELKKNE
jgi:hypothetical protein